MTKTYLQENAAQIVFILPIRDWNSPFLFNHPECANGFYPTYKGLKLFRVMSLDSQELSFYPTYKGLKFLL